MNNLAKYSLAAIAILMVAITINFGRTLEEPEEEVLSEVVTANEYEVEAASLSILENRTRKASVKIYTPTGGHGSGAYFFYKDRHIVLTAAHVVDEGGIYLVVDQNGSQRIGAVVYRDAARDFAALIIPEFEKTRPLRLRLPSYDIRRRIGEDLIFSGFPSHHSLTTIRGRVAGFEGPILIMHASAWMGSSGSSVFDESGNFVGILYGVSVGRFNGQPTIIEDFIWVLPYDQINWGELHNALEQLD